MTISIFSQKLAMEFLSSKEAFPVDLDDAWVWLGYAKKRNAKDTLFSQFEEGTDFSRSSTKSPAGGRPRQTIMLTVDCFKTLGMIALTPQGRAIRKYFLECEKIAKESVRVSNPKTAYLESLILAEPRDWSRRFSAEWEKEACRVTGYQWSYRCFAQFINEFVYSHFPVEMLDRLDVVNPLGENGRRPNKQHQHFAPDADEKGLQIHIDTVLLLMQVSTSRAELRRLAAAKFGGTIQPFFEFSR